MPEYKSTKAFTTGIDGRTVTGIFAVHGHVDDGDGWSSRDRSHPGIFGDFTAGGRKRVVFLWQHNSWEPPIARIDQLFDVARADLPAVVLKYAPDATGGTAVKRTYLDTPRGNEVLAGLQNDAITEMSYAYEPKRWDFEKPEQQSERALPVRNLYQADLLDVSDVNWGMNPATSADGSKHQSLDIEHQTVRAAVERYTKRLQALVALRAKEGRVLSGENRTRIEAALEAMANAETALRDLLTASEPQKTGRTEVNHLRAEWVAQQQRLRELGVFL